MPRKKSPREFFDSYAKEFDSVFTNRGSFPRRAVNRLFRKSTRRRYAKTLEACCPIEGKTVLDVGCGPGYYAVALAQKGARRILGIDLSPSMIALAQKHAESAGVEKTCEFVVADFAALPLREKFDYAVVQGFMDYVAEPDKIIEKTLSHTAGRAFFSFPKDGGFLAWQRKIRYRWKCDLFLYNRVQLDRLFAGRNGAKVEIVQISRDFFVTVNMKEKETEDPSSI